MNKILIVDDHPENIQVIARHLEETFPDMRLYQAVGVSQALDLLNRVGFDLIISDWNMPGQTGIDLVRTIMQNPKTSHIPVIIITAVMLTSEDLDVALSAGAFDYLRTPLEPAELTSRVNAALRLSQCHLNELKAKDLQLMEKTLIHVRHNEFNINLVLELKTLLATCEENSSLTPLLKQTIENLEEKIREDSWHTFEVSFQNIHSDFSKNLLAKHPSLTKGELQLCILLKLGMNTKDIASMLYLSPESLKVSRCRLRSKLGMQECESFHTCLSAF